MFGKTKAKIGMKLHLRSSRYYAKDIKKLYKRIRRNMDYEEEIGQLLTQQTKEKSISGVHSYINKYIDELKEQMTGLNGVLEDVYVLEDKIEEHLQKTIQDIEKLKHKEEVWNKPEIKSAFEEMHDLMRTIRNTIKTERKKVRDLKKDSHTLRNRSILPDAWVLKDLKIYSRKEKKEIKQTNKLLDEIEDIIKAAQKGNLDENKLKKLAEASPKIKKIVEEEFQGFLKLIKAAVVLIERTKQSIEALESKHIAKLEGSGFPKSVLKDILDKLEKFKDEIKREETMDVKRTQVLEKKAA